MLVNPDDKISMTNAFVIEILSLDIKEGIMIPELDIEKIRPIVENALEEDIGTGDITTDRVIPVDMEACGVIIAKAEGVVCGLPVAELVFHSVDKRLAIERKVAEGDVVGVGQEILGISGWARAILCAERVALNFLGHLSGVATLTRRFVDKSKVTILDTRKTIPGMRLLEKYAVTVGGGENHRMGLYDMILIKDNHLKIQKELGPGYIQRAISSVKKRPDDKVEMEVGSIEEAQEAVNAGVDILLLDNMSVDDISEVVRQFHGKVLLEVSGGVTLENIEDIAKTGVDYISIGALTHSATALDVSLEV